MNRRSFLKYLGLAPAAVIIGKEANALRIDELKAAPVKMEPGLFGSIPGFGMAEIKDFGITYRGALTSSEFSKLQRDKNWEMITAYGDDAAVINPINGFFYTLIQ